ncbi:MAG: exodeoxyribonuclease VII large subunit [Aquiluna sp.]|nr:exodeoxyribonuclease VII large subunit [Aquiluna sp.]
MSTEHSPWQVSQLSRSLKDWIEKLGRVWVEGELQSFSEKGGNIFGSLRDLDVESAIEIHSFANSEAEIEAGLKQGDRVVALLQPVFWPKNGKLTMRIGAMHKVGLGELLERIERLKQQLIAEGLTDPARKKPLPFLPNRIGLITGAKSDAEKDILQNARLRWPDVQFEVINTLVQGDRAAAEIIMALGQLDAMPEVDVIIVARGGGSFQDLLPFSDERLVRAAAALSKPLVSAIGHENDSPLLDLVADLRASTPTDAAKRVVPDVVEERKNLKLMRERAWYRVSSYVDAQLQLISSIRSRPVLASPFGFIDAQAEHLALLTRRIREIFDYRLKVSISEIRELRANAAALSPKLTLERGYTVLLDSEGKRVSKLKAGSKFTVITKDQEISGSADSVKERDV